MSTRPVVASIRGVDVAVTLPWRMNMPSCTLRTRSTFGLNVTVSVSVETRDTLLIEIGTVYGPPATRNSPGGVTRICAPAGGVAPGVAGAAGGVTSRGGWDTGGSVPVGGVTGGIVGCAPVAVTGGGVTGGGGAPGTVVTGVWNVGTGDVFGGTGCAVGGTPGA